MITQLISPWHEGTRTVYQFFGDSRELWVICKDNTGFVLSRSEHKLGDSFDATLGVFLKNCSSIGWEKYSS